jgi:hypothetical protein
VAGREGKRGECQTLLIRVWRESGTVRNARPKRPSEPRPSGVHREAAQWNKGAEPLVWIGVVVVQNSAVSIETDSVLHSRNLQLDTVHARAGRNV